MFALYNNLKIKKNYNRWVIKKTTTNNNTGSQIKTLTSLSRIKKILYSHDIRFSCLSRASFKYSDRSGSLNFGAILICLKNKISCCGGGSKVFCHYELLWYTHIYIFTLSSYYFYSAYLYTFVYGSRAAVYTRRQLYHGPMNVNSLIPGFFFISYHQRLWYLIII